MPVLIKRIEDAGLSKQVLLETMESYYDSSKSLYNKLYPRLKQLYYEENPQEKEMDEFSITSFVQLRGAEQELESFKRDLTDELEDMPNSKFCKELVKEATNLYNMMQHKFYYRAYKRVLDSELRKLDYRYYEVNHER